MASKNATIMICDHCGKEVSDGGHTYYGGHPFHGWISVNIRNYSTHNLAYIGRKENNTPDFCGVECLRKYFSKDETKI